MSTLRAAVHLLRQKWNTRLLPMWFYFFKSYIEGLFCPGCCPEAKKTRHDPSWCGSWAGGAKDYWGWGGWQPIKYGHYWHIRLLLWSNSVLSALHELSFNPFHHLMKQGLLLPQFYKWGKRSMKEVKDTCPTTYQSVVIILCCVAFQIQCGKMNSCSVTIWWNWLKEGILRLITRVD